MHNFLYYESLILNNCFIFFQAWDPVEKLHTVLNNAVCQFAKNLGRYAKFLKKREKKKTIKEFEETFICDCPNVLNPVDLTLTSPPLYFYYGYHYLQETDNEIQQVSKIDRWITFDILELIFKVIRN